MHILVIETTLSGHHSVYLEHIVAAHIESGHSVTVTVMPNDEKHETICRLQTRFGKYLNVVRLDGVRYEAAFRATLGLLGRDIAIRRLFGEVFWKIQKQKAVDYVFLPYLDSCLYSVGLLGSPFGTARWGGICMRPSFHYVEYGVIAPKQKVAAIKRFLFMRLLKSRTLTSVFTIDELLHRYVSDRHSKLSGQLQYLPDPAELKGNHTLRSAREALKIPQEAVVLLVYGAIDGRKGLDLLIDALSKHFVPTALHLLVVGRQAESVRQMMKSQQARSLAGRLHVIDAFVDDAMQQKAFVAADIVWLGYRNHHTMSGVLVLAVNSRKPIIATQDGLIGWYTRKNNLGLVIDINNVVSVHDAILYFCDRTNLLNFQNKNNNIFEKSTWANFEKQLLAASKKKEFQ